MLIFVLNSYLSVKIKVVITEGCSWTGIEFDRNVLQLFPVFSLYTRSRAFNVLLKNQQKHAVHRFAVKILSSLVMCIVSLLSKRAWNDDVKPTLKSPKVWVSRKVSLLWNCTNSQSRACYPCTPLVQLFFCVFWWNNTQVFTTSLISICCRVKAKYHFNLW